MLSMSCDQNDSVLKQNYSLNIARGLPGLEDYRKKIDTSRPFVLVASGPSLENFWRKLKANKNRPIICAAKTARWLTDKGLKPSCALHVHPFEQEINYVDPTVKTDYLVSTQCPPALFDFLGKNSVYAVNTINSRTFVPPHQPVLGGGTNVTSHGMWLAFMLGFKTIHLYGVDFSFTETSTHVNKTSPQLDLVKIQYHDKEFLTSSRMVTMAIETYEIIRVLNKHGVSIQIFGDGLLPFMVQDPELFSVVYKNAHEKSAANKEELENGAVTIQSN